VGGYKKNAPRSIVFFSRLLGACFFELRERAAVPNLSGGKRRVVLATPRLLFGSPGVAGRWRSFLGC